MVKLNIGIIFVVISLIIYCQGAIASSTHGASTSSSHSYTHSSSHPLNPKSKHEFVEDAEDAKLPDGDWSQFVYDYFSDYLADEHNVDDYDDVDDDDYFIDYEVYDNIWYWVYGPNENGDYEYEEFDITPEAFWEYLDYLNNEDDYDQTDGDDFDRDYDSEEERSEEYGSEEEGSDEYGSEEEGSVEYGSEEEGNEEYGSEEYSSEKEEGDNDIGPETIVDAGDEAKTQIAHEIVENTTERPITN
ncbi:uncharacterized protein LOC142232852 [Haematobia irritans]|uniref:uncharacterized protein LOC142232852 n=1 Tax=Haematobia irritans TaxID=7368 RepID=UPI003F4FE3A3